MSDINLALCHNHQRPYSCELPRHVPHATRPGASLYPALDGWRENARTIHTTTTRAMPKKRETLAQWCSGLPGTPPVSQGSYPLTPAQLRKINGLWRRRYEANNHTRTLSASEAGGSACRHSLAPSTKMDTVGHRISMRHRCCHWVGSSILLDPQRRHM